jgi:hypothetical protein
LIAVETKDTEPVEESVVVKPIAVKQNRKASARSRGRKKVEEKEDVEEKTEAVGDESVEKAVDVPSTGSMDVEREETPPKRTPRSSHKARRSRRVVGDDDDDDDEDGVDASSRKRSRTAIKPEEHDEKQQEVLEEMEETAPVRRTRSSSRKRKIS